ncbi:MAG TPA: hypothetical protein VE715_20650 [Blastocatellia bacterium]|nr:hypothetical protein [Blastocatellia bacterium]
MTQRPTSIGIFLAGALLSFAFTVSAPAQSIEWKEYSSGKGKFNVLLPGAPETGYRFGPADSGAVISYVTNYQKAAKAWSVDYRACWQAGESGGHTNLQVRATMSPMKKSLYFRGGDRYEKNQSRS